MPLFSGITANTPKHLQLDAGCFFKNYDPATDTPATAAAKLIGATSGGGSFSAVPTIRQIEIDGKRGAVKGLETIDDWVVTMTANMKEITADVLKLALATGASSAYTATASTGYTKVVASSELADANYINNITWVGRISGSQNPIIIVIKNALATNGLTLTVADKAEGVIPVTLTGHYSLSDMETPPFEIYYPNIAS